MSRPCLGPAFIWSEFRPTGSACFAGIPVTSRSLLGLLRFILWFFDVRSLAYLGSRKERNKLNCFSDILFFFFFFFFCVDAIALIYREQHPVPHHFT